MRSLQFRMTSWIALGSLAAIVAVLLLLNLYGLHRITQQSKKYLKGIACSITEIAAVAGVPTTPISPAVAASIEEHIAFIDREGSLGAAILSADGQMLYRTRHFDIALDDNLLRGDRTRLLLHSVGSDGAAANALSVWRFVLRQQDRGLIVFVCDAHHFELAERLTEGIGVALLAVILLSLPSGYLISRRLLRPFRAIDQAAARIRTGDLGARIILPGHSPEIQRLIGALNDTFAELESSFGRIQQFSADAAHELNTPLTVLRGSLEVALARERTPEEYQIVLAEMLDEIVRLSRMVRDLLLLASPGGANRRALFQAVDVAPLVAATAERLGMIAEASGIRLALNQAADARVSGDGALLQRALYNIMHNAIRYSPRDTVVEVTTTQENSTVVVEVKDQGIGIPKDQRERIFERFYRLDPNRATGSGLGLSMVKWIIELHGGRVEVESEPGRGARFRVILPKAAPVATGNPAVKT
jgi:heavy metal sensor kinase